MKKPWEGSRPRDPSFLKEKYGARPNDEITAFGGTRCSRRAGIRLRLTSIKNKRKTTGYVGQAARPPNNLELFT